MNTEEAGGGPSSIVLVIKNYETDCIKETRAAGYVVRIG
jgi:hypothetical protein